MTQIAKNANLLPPNPYGQGKIQQYYQTDLPKAATLALLETGELVDKLVIDEAQDLIRDSYLEFMKGCKSKELTISVTQVIGTFSRINSSRASS